MIKRNRKRSPTRVLRRVGRQSKASRVEKEIAEQLYELIERGCKDSETIRDVKAALGSWGNTMTTDEVLVALKQINRTGRFFVKAVAESRVMPRLTRR